MFEDDFDGMEFITETREPIVYRCPECDTPMDVKEISNGYFEPPDITGKCPRCGYTV